MMIRVLGEKGRLQVWDGGGGVERESEREREWVGGGVGEIQIAG